MAYTSPTLTARPAALTSNTLSPSITDAAGRDAVASTVPFGNPAETPWTSATRFAAGVPRLSTYMAIAHRVPARPTVKVWPNRCVLNTAARLVVGVAMLD